MHFDLITCVAPGWFELRLAGAEPRPRVLVRVEDHDGRRAITAVMVFGKQLDSTTLKQVPVARIEAVMNHPEFGLPKLDIKADVLRSMADREHLFPAEFAQIDEALRTYVEKVPEPSAGPIARGKGTRRRRKLLTRPDGTDPPTFYKLVADAYNDIILTTSAPAPILAEEAGVPVPTVHRWIAEARRRGFLPPARRGRAG